MADHLKLHLFGDQTHDVQPHMKTLLQNRNNPILEDLLVKSYDALRLEIYKLSSHGRDDLPRFTSLDDLVLWERKGIRCVPLDMALTCLYQLGTFISQADGYTNARGVTKYIGLCTGALAAAAINYSKSALDLVHNAVEAVTVAFRTGVCVTDVANQVTGMGQAEESWSIIVPGPKSSWLVERFCERTTLPLTSRPYVSAYAPNAITVSGPPESLAQFTMSENLADFRFKSLPIYAPYHAPHLYSRFDVRNIVGNSTFDQMSSVPGLAEDGFMSSLEDAVSQILLKPIRWGTILDDLQAWIGNHDSKMLSIAAIGTTADQLIYTALNQTRLSSDVPSILHKQTASSAETSYSNPKKPKLAIIGMSGRFPGAKDNEAFWDLLYQGLDVHKPVPGLHWDAKTHVDTNEQRKNTSATPFGCWLDDPAVFDARFFNISPREAPQIDPAQRLALMTAYEAIEQAGVVPDATASTRRDRVGVFYGVTSNDWMETNSAQNIDTYFIPGGNRAFIPGRINYCFKFSGPSYAVDTACSSSLAGIHIACNSLWRGDIDTAIAGGTNILTNPDFTAGLDRGHFLSRTGNCKTFDDEADGYCRGEGIGTVIIKRLDDALADKDPILGVILGAYTNHSAESESITRPHVGAQRAMFNKILNQGAVDPYTVSYVEMHGTGTQAGDAGEMSSVLDIFAPPLDKAKRPRASDETLYIGSAKANIGHGEAASGVSSLIKVLLMMRNNMVVPHCGIKSKINHKFPTDLRERNVSIALRPTPWKRSSEPSKPRRVFVNNFSAAGGNSALLLEDAPIINGPATSDADQRTHHLVAVSAKNGVSLQGNLRSMLQFLKDNPGISLGQLSYTTTARRIHHQHRTIFNESTIVGTCAQIEAALKNGTGTTRPKYMPKVVFTFTGQGAQYPGMGKQLFESFTLFRNEMHRLNHIALSLGFPSMLPVIESEEQDINFFSPIAVQLAGVCMQISLAKLWMSWNISPIAVVGHSLGEYAALNVAGVLSETDTIYAVGTRAGLLKKRCTRDSHSMLVVKGSVEAVAAVLKDNRYEIGCINSPIETVLSGPNEDIAIFQRTFKCSGIKSTLLKVPYAFHSSQIEPILDELKSIASGVRFCRPKIPVICPLDGSIIQDCDAFNPEYLADHSRKPVNMIRALLEARSSQIITDQTTVLEIGPHPAITGMVRAVLGPQVPCIASLQRGRSTWQVLGNAIKSLYDGGANIRWEKYQHDFKNSHKVLSLPAYSWDLKEYWIQYVNDWSLRKGDPPMVMQNDTPRIESTTIHRVVEETGDASKTHIVVEADIARKDLCPLVQGHEVDGIPLCTPSVYADISLSLGTYLLQKYRPNQEEKLVDVSDMTISKALILRDDAIQQLLQAHAEVDWKTSSAAIKFMSFDSKQKLQEHARCIVCFKDGSLQQELQENLAQLNGKVKNLREGIAIGTTARFNRPMVYRAIRPLARFHDDYRAIDEIVLNSNTLEAVSYLSFGSVKRGGSFHTHPAIIDSLTQSCGFTMNCNDNTDLDVEVFMNHGWGSFQIFEPIDFDKKYITYTRMEEGADKLWHGDVVILNGDRVVAYFGQIAIQGVPRRVLKVILSIESGKKSQKQRATPKKQPSISTPALSPSPQTHLLATMEGSNASKLEMALSIIAEESGLAVSDLTDTTNFGDVGVDSLLGLTISARFKEELDTDMDFNALFYEYPTVGHLRELLGDVNPIAIETTTITTSGSGSTDGSESPRSSATGITTPEAKVDFHRVLQVVSEESGVSVEDLTDDTNFADAGVDSLLSLVIVSRLRDELELDIQHESLFLDCPTVVDLKLLLMGHPTASDSTVQLSAPVASQPICNGAGEIARGASKGIATQKPMEHENPQFEDRKKAIDDYIQRYTAAFAAPGYLKASGISGESGHVVLVTGATGGLGGHLVYHIAQLPDVKTIICLNRENKTEPYTRQQKAMRDKGIRFPDTLKHKLLVLQTDSSKTRLGLSAMDYEALASSATHIIHNAWPMSAKRALPGFESQFKVMRNLVDLARDAVSRHPEGFKVSFQMVSSIGVVGHYGLGSGDEKTMVPEERVGIESVLPNGYGDAKWGCERMLDATLHRFPNRFRTMVVRLGQIAGSKTSGYWNPMEHFGFLIKSSQTLNALPDVGGQVYWTPVNDIAATLSDLVLSDRDPYPIYHIENPVGQSWREMNTVLADALQIPNLIPFEEWVERVRAAPQRNNPASTLLEFLDSNYLRMSCGGLVLDVRKSLEHSKTLAAVGPVSEEVVRKYIHVWKEIGFLN